MSYGVPRSPTRQGNGLPPVPSSPAHTHTAAELNVASSRITPFDTLVIVGVFFGSFPAPAFDTAVPTARPVYGSNESADIQLINVLNGVVSALTSCFN